MSQSLVFYIVLTIHLPEETLYIEIWARFSASENESLVFGYVYYFLYLNSYNIAYLKENDFLLKIKLNLNSLYWQDGLVRMHVRSNGSSTGVYIFVIQFILINSVNSIIRAHPILSVLSTITKTDMTGSDMHFVLENFYYIITKIQHCRGNILINKRYN
jgi:hypothetical protein